MAKITVDYRTPRASRLHQSPIIGIAEVAATTTASSEDSRGWHIVWLSGISGLARRRCAQVLPMGPCGCAREYKADEAAFTIEDAVARHIGKQHRIPSVDEGRFKSLLTYSLSILPCVEPSTPRKRDLVRARMLLKQRMRTLGSHRPSTPYRGISSSGRMCRQWHESRANHIC